MWQKDGDFSRFFDSGAPLNRMSEYQNTASGAVINSLFIGGYKGGGYQISATASSADAHQILIDALKKHGFPEPDFIDKDLKTVRIRTSVRNTMSLFLRSLKEAEPTIDAIEEEICRALSINSLNQTEALATWNKVGNFSLTHNNDTPLRRSCEYQQLAGHGLIKELFIGNYDDGDYQISAEGISSDAFNKLKEEVVKAGFPEPCYSDEMLKTIRLTTSDKSTMGIFVRSLKKAEPSLNLIEEDVSKLLDIKPVDDRAALATWTKTGNFNSLYDSGAFANRSLRFVTGQKTSLISEFSLMGYKDNTYMLSIAPSPGAENLKKALKKSGLKLEFNEYINRIYFRFGGSEYNQFEQLLRLLSQHCPQFAEISEPFKNEVSSTLLAHQTSYQPNRRSAFFERPAHRNYFSGRNNRIYGFRDRVRPQLSSELLMLDLYVLLLRCMFEPRFRSRRRLVIEGSKPAPRDTSPTLKR
jgi:hypothetical protein